MNANWQKILNWYNDELDEYHSIHKEVSKSINAINQGIPLQEKEITKKILKSKREGIKQFDKGLLHRFNALNPFNLFNYYFTIDIYHNKTLKTPYLTITQVVNTNSNTKMKLNLVWKKEIKNHKKSSTHKAIEEFIIHLTELGINYDECLFHSDKESSWQILRRNIKDYKDEFKEISIDYKLFNFLLTKGARNSPLKESCQKYDTKEIETSELKENSISLIYKMILKQISMINERFYKRIHYDNHVNKLRKEFHWK